MTEHAAPRRAPYDEGCIAAHALEIVGERWTMLVLRELMLGPKRFNSLRAGMPGLSANILTRRLEEMTARGLLAPETTPPPTSVKLYRLTALGLAFRPVLEALCRWGALAPGHKPSKFISPTGLMISMSALIDRARAARADMTLGFDLGPERFVARIGTDGFIAEPGDPAQAELLFRGTANAVAGVFYGPWPVAEAAARMGATAAGDPVRAQAAIDLFSLKSPAATRG